MLRLDREDQADEDRGDGVRRDDGRVSSHHAVGEPEQEAGKEDDERRKGEVGGRPRPPGFH